MDQFLTLDLDQFLTLETPNLGPVFNSTAYIYIYLFICVFFAVKLKIGPRFGGFKVKNWSKLKVKNWLKLFFPVPHFYSVFWASLKTQIVSHCAKIVLLQNCGDVKNEAFEKKSHFLFLSSLC